MDTVSEQGRKTILRKYASNSVSELLHVTTKDMQKKGGPKAHTGRRAAVGQSIFKNSYGNETLLITGRKPKPENEFIYELGEFYRLSFELQASSVQAVKEMSTKWKKKMISLLNTNRNALDVKEK